MALRDVLQKIDFLAGKKTYILAALQAVAFFLFKAGLIDQELYDQLVQLISVLFVGTVGARVARGG